MESIEQLISFIQHQVQSNPIIVGLVGGGILGSTIMNIRRIIGTIIQLFTIMCFNTIRVTSEDHIYEDLSTWLYLQVDSSKFRKNIITRYEWQNRVYKITLGSGYHLFLYKWRPCICWIAIEQRTMNEYTAPKDKVICRLFIFGITNSITKSFLRDIKQTHKEWFNGTYTNFYKMIVIGKDFSENMVFKPHRYRSTLFGNDLAIDALTTKLDYFLNNKEWYIEKGIPYKFNILLHGSPGVGKTSIIHFLASYIGRPLIVPGRFLNRLNELDLNDKLVILEDLDAEFLSANSKRPKDEDDEEDMFSSSDSKDLKLSTLLNLLDGLQTPDGLITSITTNNLEAFDAALLRPGRIDCILEIVPLNKSSVIDMLTHFNVSVDHCKLKNDILVPAANLQEIILGHLSHPYHHLESRINEACIKKLYES